MPRQLMKKLCPQCGRSFLTYEQGLEFCNTDCETRQAYNQALGKPMRKQTSAICAHCGDEVHCVFGATPSENRFCNEMCLKEFKRKKRIAEANNRNTDPRNNMRKICFDVLNKCAEKKRVFDEHHAKWFIARGSSYRSKK